VVRAGNQAAFNGDNMDNITSTPIPVTIDGVETTLRYDSFSGSRGHQYLTPGNRSSHAFPWKLEDRRNTAFRTNGHDYVIR
jgi:hypothetical protein